MRKIAKVLLVGTLLTGAMVPAMPSISKNVHAATVSQKKSKNYVSGHVVFYKNKVAISNKFDLPGNQPIYYTFDEKFATPKDAVYRFELVRGDGKVVVSHIKGTAHTKKEKMNRKLLAKKVKKGKYFLRFFSETPKTSVSIKYRVHN